MGRMFYGYQQYPEYKPASLNNRKSLLGSVNGRITSINRILDSSVITEDETEMVEDILVAFTQLRNKIKENNGNGKNKTKEFTISFKGTRTSS